MPSPEQQADVIKGSTPKEVMPVMVTRRYRNAIVRQALWMHVSYVNGRRFIDYGELTDPHHYDLAKKIIWQQPLKEVPKARRGRPPKQRPAEEAQ